MAKSQKVHMPGKASKFPAFDARTSTPTKGGRGNVQHGKGTKGVSGRMPIKGGGNPTGGSGGRAA